MGKNAKNSLRAIESREKLPFCTKEVEKTGKFYPWTWFKREITVPMRTSMKVLKTW